MRLTQMLKILVNCGSLAKKYRSDIKMKNRVLVIPDIHLKPQLFDRAEKILLSGQAGIAIQLGDLVDDWKKEYDFVLYASTVSRACYELGGRLHFLFIATPVKPIEFVTKPPNSSKLLPPNLSPSNY